MSAAQFHLTTDWRLDAPPEAVWAVLTVPEDWPSWWRAVERVETLDTGDAQGIGALRRMTWRTALPYALTFDMRTTRVEPMTTIEGRAEGELSGLGRWTLTPDGGGTQNRPGTNVRYDWIVDVEKPWMRRLAPLLRPVFAWNHGKVMDWGREDIARKLGRAGSVTC